MNALGLVFRNVVGRAFDLRDDTLDFLQRREQPREHSPELNHLPMLTCGHGDGRWTLCRRGLSSDSLVYSVGVGFDISFDLDLIRLFGCRVHAFDPTPISKQWLDSLQGLPEPWTHHDLGLADYSGTASFRLPPKHSVSFSMSDSVDGNQEHEAEVLTLRDIMQRLNHSHIDVLKIDIEGAEYTIIDDLAAASSQIGQLLIEFHDRMFPATPSRSATALGKLETAGFRLIHVSRRGTEFSLIGPEFLEAD